MLKKTITYEDFDDNKVSDTLYFNITKTELTENLDLVKKFEELQTMFSVKHDLVPEEIQIILDFVKTLMTLSYGIKSPDGKSFKKSDELWREFTQTAAYDAFVMSLFENPDEANAFMMGIFPKDLLAQAKIQMKDHPELLQSIELPSEGSITTLAPPTRKELTDMSKEELIEAMKNKNTEMLGK